MTAFGLVRDLVGVDARDEALDAGGQDGDGGERGEEGGAHLGFAESGRRCEGRWCEEGKARRRLKGCRERVLTRQRKRDGDESEVEVVFQTSEGCSCLARSMRMGVEGLLLM